MIKGVNKNIVEINDTGNIYFERAVLYVSPEMSDVPYSHLLKEANEYLSSCVPDFPPCKIRKKISPAAIITVAVLLSAAAALTVLLLISK